MAQYRNLQVRTQDGVVVVRFTEAWLTTDLAQGELRKELLSLAAQEDCSKFLVNCAGVTYVSSSMLGNFISLHKQMNAKGGRLAVCELTPTVQEIFTTMKFYEILDIRNTESEGLKAFE